MSAAASSHIALAAESRVYFPHEVGTALAHTSIRVAGRVVYVEAGFARITDAWAALDVQFEPALPSETLLPGALVLLAGSLRPPSDTGRWLLSQAALLSCHAGQYRVQGEQARFHAVAGALRQRQRALQTIRSYFEEQGFLEVETPTRVWAAGTDVHLDPVASEERWLITSPEFHHKRLLSGGVPRVFELARCFRADEIGLWHQPQFTLLEWYRSWESYDAVLRDTEQLITRVAQALGGPSTLTLGSYQVTLAAPYERLRVAEVFERYAKVSDVVSLAQNDEARYFSHWVNEVEPALAELGRPVFLVEFPLSQAALARPCPGAPQFAERFELFVGPVELCNGYGELTDAALQRERFERDVARRAELGKSTLPIDERFLAALQEGMPPASGNALGLDRLLSLLLMRPLKDVIAFPEE